MATRKLNIETKYKIADALASAYQNAGATPAIVNESASYYFGCIINGPISYKGKSGPLNTIMSEDDALHVTRLVMRRLSQVRAEMIGTVVV